MIGAFTVVQTWIVVVVLALAAVGTATLISTGVDAIRQTWTYDIDD